MDPGSPLKRYLALQGLQPLAAQGLQPFFAAQGLQPFAAHGLQPFAAQGLQPLAAQGLQPFALHGLQLASCTGLSETDAAAAGRAVAPASIATAPSAATDCFSGNLFCLDIKPLLDFPTGESPVCYDRKAARFSNSDGEHGKDGSPM